MPPLTRQDTRPSIHSWWSDRNPGLHGPTINIHAMAKPLMRRMYHRQALQLIRGNRDSPLSTETLEIYSSYFPLEYVFWSTKAAILLDLAQRAEIEADAHAVANSLVFDHIVQMLASPDVGARNSSCRLLGRLARHECTIPAILRLNGCERLAFLLSDEDSGVVDRAAVALSQIASCSVGARAIVDTKALLDHIPELLKSPSPSMRKWTCELMNKITSHEYTTAAAVVLELVSLLGNKDSVVADGAVEALTQIARHLDGAQAIVDARALGHISELLESTDPSIRRWTCELLGNLASHKSIRAAVLTLEPYKSLMLLLGDEDSKVVESATHALSEIARPVDGAQAIVVAGALDHISGLLESRSASIRKWTEALVEHLGFHESTRAAVLVLKPYKSLVSLLSNEDPEVIEFAVAALAHIARPVDGAQAVVGARALDHVLKLLESPRHNIRKWTCQLVRNLGWHYSTSAAVIGLEPYKSLVSLLSDNNVVVIESAVHALSQIARPVDGARAIVNAGALGHVSDLLKSPSPAIRKWTCALVGNLTFHRYTRAAVLALEPFKSLVTLLSDKDSQVIEFAVHALYKIVHPVYGTQTIASAGALDHTSGLLESTSPSIRKSTYALVGNLASTESAAASAVLALKPHKSLVSLLSDEDSAVVEGAAYVLSHIARLVDGAQAIVDAGALDHVSKLLKLPSPSIRKWTCELVGNLVVHRYTRAAVLGLNPFQSLVSLLSEEDSEVVECVAYALSQIARPVDGAQAIVDTGALNLVSDLLESPSPAVRRWTCALVGNLAWHESTAAAVLAPKTYKSLVPLLRDRDSEVIEAAAYALTQITALTQIARPGDVAQAIVDAKALDFVSQLLGSLSPNTQNWACELVGNLARHELILPAILELEPSAQLMACLREPATCASALLALSALSEWPDGVAALAEIEEFHEKLWQVLFKVPSDAETNFRIRTILGNLDRYEAGKTSTGFVDGWIGIAL